MRTVEWLTTRILSAGTIVWLVAASAVAGVVPMAPEEAPPQREMGQPISKPTLRECEVRRRSGQVRRLAFVVGNNKTRSQTLANAIADAQLMEATFVGLGYEVASLFDADRQVLVNGLDRFKEHLKSLCPHDVAVFYYAGNGFEISGVTYIATPDVEYPAAAETEQLVLSKWLRLTDVLARFAHHSGPKVIMIDTCRHDPLAKKRIAPPPPPGGLRLPPDTLVSYASEPGFEANDIGPNGRNGPYAYYLSEAIKRTDRAIEVQDLFKSVRQSVAESTKGTALQQWPFVDQTIKSLVYLGQGARVVDFKPAPRPETGRETRIALVIGNGRYDDPTLPELANAENDASTLAGALRRLGFAVAQFHNLDRARIEQELLAFQLQANGADIALIYYSGHGIERNNSPFIVPVGARLIKDTDVDGEGIAVMPLLEHLRGVRRLGILILDACRDNPLAELRNVVGDARNQRVSSGLAPFEITLENVIVAYAAQHGTSSYDGLGHNGYFMEALAENIELPGMEVGMLFRRVRDGVIRRSATQPVRQQPWTYSTLPGEPIYLAPTTQRSVSGKASRPRNPPPN